MEDLHKKFRPSQLSEVKGQEHVTKVLEQYIKTSTIPSCMIFFGSAGCGKTSTARIIAKELNPFEEGMIEVNSAVSGKVDDMRALDRDVFHYPMAGDYKTYIFDEAHRISSAAFDSLLKVTEEPPSHVKFIFVTTNLDAVPKTIQSRSDIHTFNRIPSSTIKERIREVLKEEQTQLSEELVSLAAEAGSGSLRDALVALQKILVMYRSNETQLDIVKSLGIVGPKSLGEFCKAFISNDLVKLHQASTFFDPSIVDPTRAVHSLQQFVLDARYCILDPEYAHISESNVEGLLSELNLSTEEFRKYVIQCLMYIFDMSVMLESDMSKTTNLKALMRRFVIRLAESRAQ